MTSLMEDQFWNGIAILLTNYHAVSRNVFACIIQKVVGIKKTANHCQVNSDAIKEDQSEEYTCNQLQMYLMKYNQIVPKPKLFVVYLKLLNKRDDNVTEATALIDFLNTSYTLKFNCNHLDDILMQLEGQQLKVAAVTERIDKNKTNKWLEFVFIPKFLKWCTSVNDNIVPKLKSSLNLINVEKYGELYKLLKRKYSKIALELWQEAKEATDPLKYIYEDLAIAAYLITLWKADFTETSPIVFADLGCGNGLLVFILKEEGYEGYGYDLRKRKLWSIYPERVTENLYEQAVQPVNFKLPNNVNWLIGNHSDELSPWLPVLAATLHYKTSYFLLPCCAYEFSGVKFQRRNSSISVYNDFCNYVENISNTCGFVTLKDRLKIPSTKRIAFIGIKRNYISHEFPIKTMEIEQFVSKEQDMVPNKMRDGAIQLRAKQELIRNCTQIDRTLMDALVKKIFFLLLNSAQECPPNESWYLGRHLTLSNLAQLLGKEDLRIIKSECGGLKTLLRNKHEIFAFESDFIKIRKPEVIPKSTAKLQTIKKRRCFFYENHPQGCPLNNETCTFIH